MSVLLFCWDRDWTVVVLVQHLPEKNKIKSHVNNFLKKSARVTATHTQTHNHSTGSHFNAWGFLTTLPSFTIPTPSCWRSSVRTFQRSMERPWTRERTLSNNTTQHSCGFPTVCVCERESEGQTEWERVSVCVCLSFPTGVTGQKRRQTMACKPKHTRSLVRVLPNLKGRECSGRLL